MKALLANALTAQPRVDPKRSAFLAIHWQNDVVGAGSFGSIFADRVRASGIVPRMAAALDVARAAGMTIVYVNVAHSPGHREIIPNNALFRTALGRGGFVTGTPGVQVIDELAPRGDDFVLEHSRISAFYGTDLDIILRSQRIESLFITGVATNVAVDHTARDAAQQGYDTFLIEDCCCSTDVAMHDACLLTMRVLCTGVMDLALFSRVIAEAQNVRSAAEEK